MGLDMRIWFKALPAWLLAAWASLALAGTYTGKVVGVADGDTVTVLDQAGVQHRVRLAGIDAPEKRQPFGAASKQSLAKLVFQKSVVVETHKTDRYRREVGKVLVNGEDANLAQVRAGLAWHYKQYSNEQSADDRQAYARAEAQARESRFGLWANPEQIPPWEFRRQRR